MSDEKVKGTMMIDQVRMIRGNKDKDWNKYLKPEDWNIINTKFFPLHSILSIHTKDAEMPLFSCLREATRNLRV